MNNSREQRLREAISQYVQGRLNDEEINALWQEFAKNPDLLDELEIEVGVKKLLQEGAVQKRPPVHRLPQRIWQVAAAAAILTFAVVQILKTDPLIPIEDLALSSIKADQVETGEGIRSNKDMGIMEADSLLNLGFEAAFSGNEARALQIFDLIIASFPDEPYASKAYLNRGMMLYNLRDFEGAIAAFTEASTRADSGTMTLEKAYWFLANAYIMNGMLESALAASEKTFEMQGMFKTSSYNLSERLRQDLERASSNSDQ